MRKRVVFIGGTAAVLLAVAVPVALVRGDSQAAARKFLAGGDMMYSSSSKMEGLLAASDAVVRITVSSIGPLTWNSRSGAAWDGTSQIGAAVFTPIEATVDEVWAGPQLSGAIEIWAIGDASRRWERGDVPPYGQISGGFVEGKSFILSIRRATLPWEGGDRSVWGLAGEYEANWRIDGQQAVSGTPRWNDTLIGLRAKILKAWPLRR